MNEEKQVSAIVDAAKAAKDVLPQTTAETDGALSTLVGWFNNVVLYPVKKANITYRYKLEYFQNELQEKAALIPQECIHNPNLMIVGPTLEGLKYTFDEEALRKMYANLLTSSMDSRKDDIVHPTFVHIIEQLSPAEAVFLHYLKDYRKALIDYECATFFGNNLISIPINFEDQNIVLYINNYIRLGLFEKILSNRDSCVYEFSQLEDLAFEECRQMASEEMEFKLSHDDFLRDFKCRYYWLQLTNLGDDFIKTCVE